MNRGLCGVSGGRAVIEMRWCGWDRLRDALCFRFEVLDFILVGFLERRNRRITLS